MTNSITFTILTVDEYNKQTKSGEINIIDWIKENYLIVTIIAVVVGIISVAAVINFLNTKKKKKLQKEAETIKICPKCRIIMNLSENGKYFTCPSCRNVVLGDISEPRSKPKGYTLHRSALEQSDQFLSRFSDLMQYPRQTQQPIPQYPQQPPVFIPQIESTPQPFQQPRISQQYLPSQQTQLPVPQAPQYFPQTQHQQQIPPPQIQQQFNQPRCPTCIGVLSYNQEYQKWYCYQCLRYY